MLSVAILRVIMLSVAILRVTMLSVVILSGIKLSVVMQNVILLSHCNHAKCYCTEYCYTERESQNAGCCYTQWH